MNKVYFTSLNLKQVDIALLVLRLGVAALMLTHGTPKLIKLFTQDEITFQDPLGLGMVTTLALVVFAEFICSILIAVGLATRLAVIPLIITMLTVLLIVHADSPFAKQEMPLIYLLIYVVLLITGAGKFALDYYGLKKNKEK